VIRTTLLVEGEEIEFFRVVLEGAGIGEGELEFAALVFMAEREHVVLDGAGAVEAPVVFGDGERELLLHGGFGFEAVDEFVAERVVGFAIFGGEDADLAREAVTEVVPAGTFFTCDRRGAAGMPGVAAVGFELLFGNHGCSVPFQVPSGAYRKEADGLTY